jgi:hypothetical protein
MTRDRQGRLRLVYRLPDPVETAAEMIQESEGQWTAPQMLPGIELQQPVMTTMADGTLVVAFVDKHYGQRHGGHAEAVFVMHSRDDGASWEEPVLVAAQGDPPISSYVMRLIEARPGELHLVRRRIGDNFSGLLHHSTSFDGGPSWAAPTAVAPGPAVYSAGQTSYALVADGTGRPHLVFHESSYLDGSSNPDVTIRHLIWESGAWQAQPVVAHGGRSIKPGTAGAVDRHGCVHILWSEMLGSEFGGLENSRLHYVKRGTGC